MSLHTDGNAIAGVLEEIFGVEMTATMRVCQSCGQERAIGSHRLYRGAGLVLRCPNCGDLAAVIVTSRVKLFGTWSEELV
jgi:predicted RNA-binding Zn-ribbon protein involved in translation (DUF1610 family)